MASKNKSWKELTFKNKFAYVTAACSFTFGWVLTYWNFMIEPMGEISDSTLWILGQSLTYTGAVIGITTYVKNTVDELKRNGTDEGD